MLIDHKNVKIRNNQNQYKVSYSNTVPNFFKQPLSESWGDYSNYYSLVDVESTLTSVCTAVSTTTVSLYKNLFTKKPDGYNIFSLRAKPVLYQTLDANFNVESK